MSGSTPPSNVITPAQWQGPPWAMNPIWPSPPPPGVPPWPQPPSCFSELAQLNQCYNSVQMMEAILAKVMTDLVTNNVAVQQAIVAAIAASGSNVPLIGVTNGSQAQPGQVGEVKLFEQVITTTGAIAQLLTVNMGNLTPGDWDVWAWAYYNTELGSVNFYLQPVPTGFFYNMQAFHIDNPGILDDVVVSPQVQGLTSVTVPLVFGFEFNQTGAVVTGGTCAFFVAARRRR
jgi:hypothetical protein